MSAMILVVEDELTTLQLVKMVLKRNGYRLSTATNGHDALHMADDLLPDLILLDIILPGMDGFQVCQYLRRNPRTANIPIIMFSGLDRVTDQRRAFAVGSNDFISKPVKMADLLQRIDAHLRLRPIQQL